MAKWAMAAHTTPAQYALILIDLARERGIDSAALLAGSSLQHSGIAGIGARVADTDFHQLAENALALTGDPALGLRLGQRLNLSAHAVLGQAFMTCRNLGEVMQLFERYYHVLAGELDLAFAEEAGRVWITVTAAANQLPLHLGLETMAAALRNTLDGLLGHRVVPLRFEFPYHAPAHARTYYDVLGDDLHFASPQARWSLDAAHLDTPLPSANPALRELYEAECARLLADLEGSSDLAAQTRRLLRKLEGQYPKMPQLAAMLNVSARTYRRRLAREGCSYQDLLDDVRAEQATRLLRERRLPVSSIAYRMGFSDPSNFRRAYRRWTGRTPGDVRRAPDEAAL